MSTFSVGMAGIALMLVLIALRMPIGFTMLVTGIGGIFFLYDGNLNVVFGTLDGIPFKTASNFVLTTVPLFILMGQFAFRSGISSELFTAARHWLGHLPGGLAVASIGTCAGFAAASGSSVATAASIGTITIPEMRNHGVHPRLATAVIAAGGTLGIMIPPSLGLVVYGLTAEQSIGRLLLAAVVPGILLASIMMLMVIGLAMARPALAPRLPVSSWQERISSIKGVIGILLLFTLVMGSIYFGVATPTEAAALGAFGAMVIALLKGRLNWEALKLSLLETGTLTCMIFLIIIGSHVFSVFLSATQVPTALADMLNGLGLSRTALLLVIIFGYLVLGCFLDVMAMIVLTVPIILPSIVSLGMDPIWFGIIIILVMEMALITPPVGLNVFVIHSVTPDVPLGTIFAGIWPFLAAMFAVIALLILQPGLALWLPGQMF